MKKSGIYQIKNTINNKKYIGSSKNMKKRWSTHKRTLKNNTHHCTYLQRAVNKYGLENFTFEVIEYCDIDDLFIKEKIYIDESNNLYNIGSVGGGDNLTNHPNREQIVENITEAIKKRYNNMSASEIKEKYSRPKDQNSNWKGGISNKNECPDCGSLKKYNSNRCYDCSLKHRSGKNNPFYGKEHSQETKKKISKIRKKDNWISNVDPSKLSYTKKYKLTYPDGSKEIFIGSKPLAEKFNVTRACISKHANKGQIITSKKSKQMHGYKIEIIGSMSDEM